MKEKSWLEEMIERESLPQTLRQETVDSFCQRHGIHPTTYYYQSRKSENQKKILELSLNTAKSEVPEVLNVLIDNAKKGKEKSIEMYLDYVLKLAKNLDVKSDGQPLSTLNYEQAISIIRAGEGSNKNDSTERIDSICRGGKEELSGELAS